MSTARAPLLRHCEAGNPPKSMKFPGPMSAAGPAPSTSWIANAGDAILFPVITVSLRRWQSRHEPLARHGGQPATIHRHAKSEDTAPWHASASEHSRANEH
jgi:hypothetical protein